MRRLIPLLIVVTLGLVPRTGFGYRPFKGTDADLVHTGSLEIALGPATYIHEGSDRLLELPKLKLNAGVHPMLEVGVGATHLRLLGREGRSMLAGTKATLKILLRRGSRQDGTGPSVAMELEALLPEVGGAGYAGGALAFIVSQRWPGGMIHANLVSELTRDTGTLLLFSVILEGPKQWTVRPVFEFFLEYEAPHHVARAALAGLLWTPVDQLRIDAAVRVLGANGTREIVVTAGLTWKIAIVRG